MRTAESMLAISGVESADWGLKLFMLTLPRKSDRLQPRHSRGAPVAVPRRCFAVDRGLPPMRTGGILAPNSNFLAQ